MPKTNKRVFYCPHCNQKLSFLDGSVIKLVGRLHAANFSCKTMFYISAELGQYGAVIGEGVRIKEGAVVEFECINGACKRNFTSMYDRHLAEIKMCDEQGKQYVVVFNKIYGRRATFLVDLTQKTLLDSFGEHAPDHADYFEGSLNFFGE